MEHLKVSGAVRPLKWPLGVKWLICNFGSFSRTFLIYVRKNLRIVRYIWKPKWAREQNILGKRCFR
jgi:hypothetical protein